MYCICNLCNNNCILSCHLYNIIGDTMYYNYNLGNNCK